MNITFFVVLSVRLSSLCLLDVIATRENLMYCTRTLSVGLSRCATDSVPILWLIFNLQHVSHTIRRSVGAQQKL
jgi:hypothetical protein